MRVKLRPSFGADLSLDVHDVYKGTAFDTLRDAAHDFAKSVGLMALDFENTTTPQGEAVVAFTLGTGQRFYAYESF